MKQILMRRFSAHTDTGENPVFMWVGEVLQG